MILAGHQPNYLPYAGFFHKIAQADAFVIVDQVQFVKRGPFGWIHRNKIRTPEGWEWLTVPVQTSGKFTQTIHETRIDNGRPWARKHWKSMQWNYKKAPFFKQVEDGFSDIYASPWESLCDLNLALIQRMMKLLKLEKPCVRQSEIGAEGKASDLVLDLCKKMDADTYLSGIHGKDYLDMELFKKNGIKIVFQEFQHPAYSQCHQGEFIPNLSMIDMLFNCGDRTLPLLMGTHV